MTHPDAAALHRLLEKWRAIATEGAHLCSFKTCADDLAAVLSQLQTSETKEDTRGCNEVAPVDSLTASENQQRVEEEEISVCKACGAEVIWHTTRLLYDCTQCGRIDGSAKLVKRLIPAPATTHEPTVAGWQPIATAPKDGTEVVLLGVLWADPAQRVRSCVSRYCLSRDDSPAYALGWYFAAPGYTSGFDPSHWMPLPAPPGAAVRVSTQEEKEQAHDDLTRVDSKGGADQPLTAADNEVK